MVFGLCSGQHPNKGVFSFGTGKILYVLEYVEEIRAVGGFLVRTSVRKFTTDSFDVIIPFHTASPEILVNNAIVTGAASGG